MQFRNLCEGSHKHPCWPNYGVVKGDEASQPTCSHEVLVKTGDPSSNFAKTGISFFKNSGYVGPLHSCSTLSRSSVATFSFCLRSGLGVSNGRRKAFLHGQYQLHRGGSDTVPRPGSPSLAAKASMFFSDMAALAAEQGASRRGAKPFQLSAA